MKPVWNKFFRCVDLQKICALNLKIAFVISVTWKQVLRYHKTSRSPSQGNTYVAMARITVPGLCVRSRFHPY